jgi:hypothetical protein
VVASALQRDGLIKYTRGKIHILDRGRLEETACGCYQVLKNFYGKLYKEPWLASGVHTS